jgi:hypothetical protein
LTRARRAGPPQANVTVDLAAQAVGDGRPAGDDERWIETRHGCPSRSEHGQNIYETGFADLPCGEIMLTFKLNMGLGRAPESRAH